jgi:hypothetical protein
MATKANPGRYDCYANAEPDEPLFTLLARDPTAEFFVAAWAAVRAGDLEEAQKLMVDAKIALQKAGKPLLPYDSPKLVEAQECAKAMHTWHQAKADEAAVP